MKSHLHIKIVSMLAVFIVFFSVDTLAQHEVSGMVIDASTSEPLPAVNILVKGTTRGTTSDTNGQYELPVESSTDTLVFSYVGYESQEVPIQGRSEINVSLQAKAFVGEDLVVVGYGTQQREDVTGSISQVSSEEIEKYSTTDPSGVLRGRVPGLQVKSDGEPGAAPNIQIRGVGTFGNSQPLYVIDGVPVGTSIRDFNPNNIASIEVLKDASAAAIYGSRAANGVVLITTETGTKDTPLQVNYSGTFGVSEIWQDIPVTERENYQMLSNEGQINAGETLNPGNDPNHPNFVDDVNTDWQEEGLKTGQRMNHTLKFSGGGDYTTYNVSLDYVDDRGTLVGHGPDYKRYSARLNTTMEKGIFEFGQNFYYTHTDEKALNYNTNVLTGGRPPMIVDLNIAVPTLKVYDESNIGGCAGTKSDVHNVIVLNVPCTNQLLEGVTNVDRSFASGYAQANILDQDDQALTYKLNVSYDRTNVRNFNWVPEFEMGFFFNNTSARLNDGQDIYTTAVVENTLTYEKVFADRHDVTALIGQTYQKGSSVLRNGYSEAYGQPYFPVLDNGSNKTASGEEYENALASYFSRLNYNYDDRYLLTATIRRDGSSRFAPENRYGNFPSASVGWNLHNEEFIPLPDFISELKLRASYGKLGNQNIDDYLYSSTVNPGVVYNFDGSKVIGSIQTQITDSGIKWETKTTKNIGVDASFLDRTIDFSAEYYESVTSDILVGVPIPLSVGANNDPTVNAGELQNTGLEFSATYRKSRGDFTFEITANLSTLRNEVLALGGNDEPISGVGTRTEVGGEVGRHYGYVADGIFQSQDEIDDHAFQNAGTAPGDLRFKDLNDDGIINDEDRTYLGSGLPSINYGLNFAGEYKNFDFTIFASGMGDYLIHSRMYRTLMATSDYMNYHTDMLDRWTPENTNTDVPRRIVGDPNNNNRNSDRAGWLQDGTHLRINTLQLGYTLPENLIDYLSIRNARIYVNAQNVYTFTAYKGYNPDFTSGVFEPGYNNGSYPVPRTLTVGVDIGF
ncbi:SusC/RagA family TonB-linked outer membrane protein [Aliifodinibius salipaludis]|uniref:SusC/RagA family TonB-linked outer membrane protein n=1 Tax=Fodinibius salipaludis TaxID=2032627 RepID=A0A2A2GFV7_9BACT|nr:TonB-dependent receptor [Aliifodinibius salipaludis]PAU95874.1 SusC/RagA family TonB-linked outer membrane protein [Aliifodinibius salipaludis]